MKAVDYLKAKGRLCKQYRCGRCPLRACDTIGPTGYQAEYSCIKLERESPEQAIAIVEKWAKENPVKTYLSVLLEKFPNARMHNDSGIPSPTICPHSIFNIEEKCPPTHCVDCWNREYKEGGMNHKVGDVVRVVGNHNAHGFEIGELVAITEVFEEDEDYRADGKDDFWYIRDIDCESVVREESK